LGRKVELNTPDGGRWAPKGTGRKTYSATHEVIVPDGGGRKKMAAKRSAKEACTRSCALSREV